MPWNHASGCRGKGMAWLESTREKELGQEGEISPVPTLCEMVEMSMQMATAMTVTWDCIASWPSHTRSKCRMTRPILSSLPQEQQVVEARRRRQLSIHWHAPPTLEIWILCAPS